VNVLIIEDHADLAANIGEYLEAQGHTIDFAADGLTGLHLISCNRYDTIVLDLSIPGIDGLQLSQRIRRDGAIDTPILMLTARDTLEDKLSGFAAGADDYVTKPFALAELHMRLQSLARRGPGVGSNRLRVGDLTLDLRTLQARRGTRSLSLTPTGLRILECLMRDSPAVIRRETVEQLIWGDDRPESDAALRSHIHQLRQAVDQAGENKLLKTVHGIGYRLVQDDPG